MSHPYTCLLVDDDKDDQEIFLIALSESGLNMGLEIADDGCDALIKLQSSPFFEPDLILLDINMPKQNGWECLTQIRAIDRLAKTPIYMYSTSSAEFDKDTAERLGANGFIQKPSTVDELCGVLQNTFHSFPKIDSLK